MSLPRAWHSSVPACLCFFIEWKMFGKMFSNKLLLSVLIPKSLPLRLIKMRGGSKFPSDQREYLMMLKIGWISGYVKFCVQIEKKSCLKSKQKVFPHIKEKLHIKIVITLPLSLSTIFPDMDKIDFRLQANFRGWKMSANSHSF